MWLIGLGGMKIFGVNGDDLYTARMGYLDQTGYIQRRRSLENSMQVVQVGLVKCVCLQVAVCENK